MSTSRFVAKAWPKSLGHVKEFSVLGPPAFQALSHFPICFPTKRGECLVFSQEYRQGRALRVEMIDVTNIRKAITNLKIRMNLAGGRGGQEHRSIAGGTKRGARRAVACGVGARCGTSSTTVWN